MVSALKFFRKARKPEGAAPSIEVRPLTRIAGNSSVEAGNGTAYSKEMLAYFKDYPPRSFMSDESRAVLFSLIRTLRPKVVAEIGTLFAGTTEVMARALWENGEGVIHTTDPFGVDRHPDAIIGGWPQELREITHFHPLNSMAFFQELGGRQTVLDLVLVDGSHDYEYALFDLQMAARLLRPGGVIVMDNSEQSGPFQAARTFLAAHPAWRELGSSIASYDPSKPFDDSRASMQFTSFVIIQAPDHLSISVGPHSWGQAYVKTSAMAGFSLDLPAQVAAGTLHYQAILRAFSEGNRDAEEIKSRGSVRLDLAGRSMLLNHGLKTTLRSKMHDAERFTFEIDLSWQADRGAPPLALAGIPALFAEEEMEH